MFYTMEELERMLIDSVSKTLADMECNYKYKFEYAISEIRHAQCEMVCFGIHNAQLWDGSVLAAIKSARNAEEDWKQAKQLYDETIEHYGNK